MYLLAIQVNRANEFAVLEHRHRNKSSRARGFDEGNDLGSNFPNVGVVGAEIGNMNKLSGFRETIQRNSRTLLQIDHGMMSHMIDKALRAVDCDSAKDTVFEEPKVAECGLTDAGRVRQHCIENRLKLSRRARDDFQHL